MTDVSIVTQLPLWTFPLGWPQSPEKWPDLHTLWQFREHLPECVTSLPTVMRCFELLSPLDWAHFPERNLQRHWGQSQIPYAALAAAELIRLNEHRPSTSSLHGLLLEHPGFICLLGFPLALAPETPLGFNPLASLPTRQHWNKMLRRIPNAALQFLLTDSVRLILAALHARHVPDVDCVSLDTKVG